MTHNSTESLFHALIELADHGIMKAVNKPEGLKEVSKTISNITTTIKFRIFHSDAHTRDNTEPVLAPLQLEMWDLAESHRQLNTSMNERMRALEKEMASLKRSRQMEQRCLSA